METRLPDGTCVEIDHFRESEHAAGQRLLNGVIEEGLSWPFEETMDMNAFRAYFLSHAAFVVRTVSPASSSSSSCARPPGEERLGTEGSAPTAAGPDSRGPSGTALQSDGEDEEHEVGDEGEGVWGVFYIKPNFPGRCSHVCNGGFITDPRRRRRGVARLMGHAFLRLAKDLGYKASYFNLVFRSNEASLALWRGLGFTELAVVPKAGRLRGIDGLVDAIQFYYDLEALRRGDLPEDLRGPS
ncbi:unnamed protein product [Scytosiphon promiscuus]